MRCGSSLYDICLSCVFMSDGRRVQPCVIGWETLLSPSGQHSGRFLRKPQHFCAASCWPGVEPVYNKCVAGGVCSGVICRSSIFYCVQLKQSVQLHCTSLCGQNTSSTMMLCAPRTVQELNSKTFRGSGHAKNKWIHHIEQTELCYAEKSPTVDRPHFENLNVAFWPSDHRF